MISFAGWAVEGAVGSSYKIDATYLSPHVNLAARMKSACKQYKLTILLSEDVVDLLSGSAKKVLRHVDTVIVKGVSERKRIYTYDARLKGNDSFFLLLLFLLCLFDSYELRLVLIFLCNTFSILTLLTGRLF